MNSLLQSLVDARSAEASTEKKPIPKRRRSFAGAIPWLLLVGFLAIAWALFGEQLLPAVPVKAEAVVTVRSGTDGAAPRSRETAPPDPWAGPALFQSSGWVEPDPLPIKATALVDGIVDSVAVLEGQKVERGQPLATLVQEDFQLNLEEALGMLTALEAEAEANEASIDAIDAKTRTVQLEVKAGELKCLELEDRRDRLERAGSGAVAEGDLAAATLMAQTHAGVVDALEASLQELIAEKRRLEAVRMNFASRIEVAKTDVAKAELALSRTEIASPVDGVVLRLLAVPGQKRMLGMDDPDSSTIAILYQPDSLQARIDVPLEEAASLSVGQAVRLRSSLLPDTVFRGEVTRIAGEADLQRNTLQAKVRIENPDPRLRPDMLCRAEFLANAAHPAVFGSEEASTDPVSVPGRVELFVPIAALSGDGDDSTVFVLTEEGTRAERRKVRLGREEREGFRLVLEGLKPGDRVVLDPPADLGDGDRVSPRAEGGDS